MSAAELLLALKGLGTLERAKSSARFFKSEPGQYGYGDKFLGVTVPEQRAVAKHFKFMPLQEIDKALQSEWHEVRLTTLFVLVDQFNKASSDDEEKLLELYLENTGRVNNWDLVDSSAPQILGNYLVDRPEKRKVLYHLAKSKVLWEQRIAVVANMALIQNNEFNEILEISKRLLNHKHDLIHKATGWMLREMGDRNINLLCDFLDEHATSMPRTMLRYSIEKFPQTLRETYMSR